MGDRWKHPVDEALIGCPANERGDVLIELLGLADALPPRPHRDLDAPSFRELCDRR